MSINKVNPLRIMVRKKGLGKGGLSHLTRAADKDHLLFKIFKDMWSDITHMAISTFTPK